VKAVRHIIIVSFALSLLPWLQPFAMSEKPMTSAKPPDVEAAVCGSFREPFMFWLWHSMAGAANPQGLTNVQGVAPVKFKTRDGITLGGYRLAAENPKAYLLVAQGNAMLADQLIADLQTFRDRGSDVYIHDYRGYGISQGKSRLAAIVDDYVEIVGHLNTLGYARRFLYGISMGGVILLDAVGNRNLYTRLVVDSSPARISNLGCPERFDPVAHLPNDGARVMIISGGRDAVVPPGQMGELIHMARSRGARIVQDPELAHPYQDSSPALHLRRQHEVANFLYHE
jgi:predicted esterase